MTTIWKFPFPVTDTVAIDMPVGASILAHLEPARLEQGEHGLVLWAVVDPDKPTETRVFHVVGTGNPMPDGTLNYIGSTLAGPFVWHVFERLGVSVPAELLGWDEEAKS